MPDFKTDNNIISGVTNPRMKVHKKVKSSKMRVKKHSKSGSRWLSKHIKFKIPSQYQNQTDKGF